MENGKGIGPGLEYKDEDLGGERSRGFSPTVVLVERERWRADPRLVGR